MIHDDDGSIDAGVWMPADRGTGDRAVQIVVNGTGTIRVIDDRASTGPTNTINTPAATAATAGERITLTPGGPMVRVEVVGPMPTRGDSKEEQDSWIDSIKRWWNGDDEDSSTSSPSGTSTSSPSSTSTSSPSGTSTGTSTEPDEQPTAVGEPCRTMSPMLALDSGDGQQAPASTDGDCTPQVGASPTSSGTSSPTTTPSGGTGASAGTGGITWLSGASGVGVTDGAFETWRGAPVTIAATWADNDEASSNFWQLDPGSEFGSWTESLDISVGAFDSGGSWAAGAGGAYDERWRASLTTLKAKWDKLPHNEGALAYIRFAHEMDGNWYPWQVREGDRADFIAAWKRYRAIQQDVFPQAQLVFNVNRESTQGFDWRTTFPGAEYVDVMGVDYYNQFPYAATNSDFDAQSREVDSYGAPKGIRAHLAFAKSVGLPLGLGEWSGNADNGDSPAFITGMLGVFKDNAGTGAGNLRYEIQFNVDKDGGRWLLTGGTRMAKSAAVYADTLSSLARRTRSVAPTPQTGRDDKQPAAESSVQPSSQSPPSESSALASAPSSGPLVDGESGPSAGTGSSASSGSGSSSAPSPEFSGGSGEESSITISPRRGGAADDRITVTKGG